MKLPLGCVWVMLAALSGCGTSDPKNAGGAGQSQGVSGSAAELGGADSSEAGSTGTPGGRAGVGGAGSSGAGETSAGSSNHAGAAGATGGGGGSAPPDIPSTTLLSDLDDTQQGALCDWHASVFGGYGHSVNCGMGTAIFPADQAACVSTTFPAYCKKATVGDFEACVTSGIPSHGCDLTNECSRLYCP